MNRPVGPAFHRNEQTCRSGGLSGPAATWP